MFGILNPSQTRQEQMWQDTWQQTLLASSETATLTAPG